MFLAIVFVFMIGGVTGAAIDHNYPAVGAAIVQEQP